MQDAINLLQYLLGSYQPYPDVEATRPMVWALNKIWTSDYAGPLFDALPSSSTFGWRTDWIRASKHFFTGYVLSGVLWDPGYVPGSTLEVPREPLSQILQWLTGYQPFSYLEMGEAGRFSNHAQRQVLVRKFLSDYAFNVWAEANELRLLKFNEYSMRAPRDLIPPSELPKKWQEEGVPL